MTWEIAALLVLALTGGLFAVGFTIGKRSATIPTWWLVVSFLMFWALGVGLLVGHAQRGRQASTALNEKQVSAFPKAQISTQFTMSCAKEHSTGGWIVIWGSAAGFALIGILIGASGGDSPIAGITAVIAGFFGCCVGLLIGVLGVQFIISPSQDIITTLESDGVKVWGFNERSPDVTKKGRAKLFALQLDSIGAAESGNAFATFGANIWIGALRVLHTAPVAQESHRAVEASQRRNTTAIWLRASSGLTPVYADNIGAAQAFKLVSQINGFLDDARQCRGATPQPSAPLSSPTPAAPPLRAGWDL